MEALFEDGLFAGEGSSRITVIAGVILAAGASSRMGSPKALLRFQGTTFLDHCVAKFRSVCDPVIVVLGHHRQQIVDGVEQRDNVIFIVNPDPGKGMLSSLQYGLRQVPSNASGVLFTPVDLPTVQASTIELIRARFLHTHPPIALPQYQLQRGHPVCISPAVAEELLALPPTGQAREIIHRHRSASIVVEVDDPGISADIDLPEDYYALVNAK